MWTGEQFPVCSHLRRWLGESQCPGPSRLSSSGESAGFTGLSKLSQPDRELLLHVGGDCCIIRTQQVFDDSLPYLGPGSMPIVQVNAFCSSAKCIWQEKDEEDCNECGCKYAPLFYSTTYVKALWAAVIELHCSLHILLEELDHYSLGGQPISGGVWKRSSWLTRSLKVKDGLAEVHLLFTTFLLFLLLMC